MNLDFNITFRINNQTGDAAWGGAMLKHVTDGAEAFTKGSNMLPTMRKISVVQKGIMFRAFHEQRDPETLTHWKGLRPMTLAGRIPGRPILSETAQLENSIMTTPAIISPNTSAVGTNYISAAVHQYGAVLRPKHGQFLAVPVTQEARNAGSVANFIRAHKGQNPFFYRASRNSSARATYEVPRSRAHGASVRVASPTRGLFLAVPTSGAHLQIHFVFLPSVTIVARSFAGYGMRDLEGIGMLTALDWSKFTINYAGIASGAGVTYI